MKNNKHGDRINAAVYARFSSDNQRDESIDAQLRAIEKYASDNGIHIVARYVDRAFSARFDKRPEFQRMIRDSEKGEFNMVLVHKLDRFSRNRYDSAFYKHILKNNGVRLQSVIEDFDDTPESIILESVIEGMSEYYSANLGRETMKGLKENAHKGIHTGGRPPLGYKVDPITKRIEVNEEEAGAVRLIFDMVSSGEKYSAVAEALNQRGYRTRNGNPFASPSIHEILKNQKYVGICIYNKRVSQSVANTSRKFKDESEWIVKDDVYPPLVTQEVFDNVQKRLAARKVSGQAHAKEVYLLSGKIRCGVCGCAYCGERKTNSKGTHSYSYFCNSRNKHTETKCSNPSIQRSVIETFVLEKLSEFVFD
ncbi:MAG: recombinase family protein, partial [Ruminococcus sp.]|nr:recombinase family protein [Ruminococcus sp.]